jgi:hypothetical protein
MTFDIHDLGPDTTVTDLCTTLGEMLELGRPLPEGAARAAVTRPDYARFLWAARGKPVLLQHLIASAPPPGNSGARFAAGVRVPAPGPSASAPRVADSVHVEGAADIAAGVGAEPRVDVGPGEAGADAGADVEAGAARSSASLVLQASRSLLRWAAGSFKVVDDDHYARRMAACGSCEHLRAPAGNLVHDIVRAIDPAARVCGLCGCVAAKKARLPHESCPAADPHDTTVTRWGEPRAGAAATR